MTHHGRPFPPPFAVLLAAVLSVAPFVAFAAGALPASPTAPGEEAAGSSSSAGPPSAAAAEAVPSPSAAGDGEAGSYADSWPPAGVPVFELPDTIMVEARRHGYGPRQVELLYDYFRSDLADTLGPRPSAFALRPRTRTLSRLEQVAFSADRAANTALFLGGVGHFIGLWDEKTALTMMGAGAALGAIWGTTVGGRDSGIRIEVDARREER